MGILAAVYSPAELVTKSRVKPTSGRVTVTLAPGIAAPEASVTEPTSVAWSCALAVKDNAKKSVPASRVRCLRSSPSCGRRVSARALSVFPIAHLRLRLLLRLTQRITCRSKLQSRTTGAGILRSLVLRDYSTLISHADAWKVRN